MREAGAGRIERLIAETRAFFRSRYETKPEGVVVVPGRVNLIGEHTDYNAGLVLPFAADRFLVAAFGAPDRPGEFGLASTRASRTGRHRIDDPPGAAAGWERYPAGLVALLVERGHEPPALNLAFGGDLEPGAGLSSSAALTVATLEVLRGRGVAAPEGLDAARLCRDVEHRFLGVPCGIMDPFAILEGRPGMARLLDCRSETSEEVEIASTGFVFELLTSNDISGHALADGVYARRRAECEAAAAALGVSTLRELDEYEALGAAAALPAPLGDRVRHVVGENARVRDFVEALRSRRPERAGALLTGSHRSLSRDFAVSTPFLDATVEALVGARGAAAGVLGARMIGGGFGGSILVLRERESERAALTTTLEDALGASFDLRSVHAVAGPRRHAV